MAGRKRKTGKREKNGRPCRKEFAFEQARPNEAVEQRRYLFSFVRPPANVRQDGRNGEIDSEVFDPIGQMCAVGLFDGHGHDPVEMRDKGRDWGHLYVQRFKGCALKIAAFERRDRSTNSSAAVSPEDLYFERLDEALPLGIERDALFELIVVPLLATTDRDKEGPPWALGLIDCGLLERGRIPTRRTTDGTVMPMILPTLHDKELLNAVIRGLCGLCDGTAKPRWAA